MRLVMFNKPHFDVGPKPEFPQHGKQRPEPGIRQPRTDRVQQGDPGFSSEQDTGQSDAIRQFDEVKVHVSPVGTPEIIPDRRWRRLDLAADCNDINVGGMKTGQSQHFDNRSSRQRGCEFLPIESLLVRSRNEDAAGHDRGARIVGQPDAKDVNSRLSCHLRLLPLLV